MSDLITEAVPRDKISSKGLTSYYFVSSLPLASNAVAGSSIGESGNEDTLSIITSVLFSAGLRHLIYHKKLLVYNRILKIKELGRVFIQF